LARGEKIYEGISMCNLVGSKIRKNLAILGRKRLGFVKIGCGWFGLINKLKRK
jgi:hypothetical protein